MSEKSWKKMTDYEKMMHILSTPIGRVPCDDSCNECPIGGFNHCGDDVSYSRARRWLAKNALVPEGYQEGI